MIEQQFERLTYDEQRILEAASVLGIEFSAAVVAAALRKSSLRLRRVVTCWCATITS